MAELMLSGSWVLTVSGYVNQAKYNDNCDTFWLISSDSFQETSTFTYMWITLFQTWGDCVCNEIN